MVPTWDAGRPVDHEVNFQKIVEEGWRKNELIFSCINKTANTSAQVNLQVIDSASAVIKEHPLKALIDQPNPFMSQFDFWYAVLAYQKLAGWAVFEKERSALGIPVALWPLRPDWVSEIPDSKQVVAGYEYAPPGLKPQFIPREDVLVFKVFDPLGIYHYFPPVGVAGRVGTVDNSTTDFLAQFFKQGGVPPGILKTRIKINDATVTDIRRRWGERYGGFQNWNAPAVLDSDAEYQKIGLDFREMGFEILDARNEARICMVLDVPPIMVSANIGLLRSTFSNYREARLAWWQDSLVPTYANLEDGLLTGLKDDFPGVETQWDFGRVPALQEERSKRWERAVAAFTAGAITLNQFAMEVGFPGYGPWGDHLVRQLSYVEIRPGRPTPESNPAIEPTNSPADKEFGVPTGSNGTPTPGNMPTAKHTKQAPPPEKEAIEENMATNMTEFLAEQRDRVLANLKENYG
jgi:HK97 family phage portal protein